MRDKTHIEFVERWADFIKNKKRDELKPKLNEFIDAQFEISRRAIVNLERTDEGKAALGRLIEWRKNR